MPVLMNCPHCTFPTVVGGHLRGKARLCKQCGHGYVVSRSENRIHRLNVSSNAELLTIARRPRQPKVWVIAN